MVVVIVAGAFGLVANAQQPSAPSERLANARAAVSPANLAANPLEDNWGCEVLLCLSNPKGPAAVPECRNPIDRLQQHIARGRPFPVCRMQDGRSSAQAGTWVQPGYNHYERCPAGTTALAAGQLAINAAGATAARPTVYSGIGDGSELRPGFDGTNAPLPPLVCVGALQTTQSFTRLVGESYETYSVGVYDRVVLRAPNASGQIYDVYIENQIWQRTRM